MDLPKKRFQKTILAKFEILESPSSIKHSFVSLRELGMTLLDFSVASFGTHLWTVNLPSSCTSTTALNVSPCVFQNSCELSFNCPPSWTMESRSAIDLRIILGTVCFWHWYWCLGSTQFVSEQIMKDWTMIIYYLRYLFN